MILTIALMVCVGALAAFIRHRRAKALRPPHAYDRSLWSGT